MRVPLSWLRDLLPGLTASADEVAAALVRAGLEVEQILRYGDDVTGVVVGRVVDVEELTEFKKPIRFCHVDTGSRVHDVVCGATNFAAGDRIAFAQPGAVLPGDFRIATRQTYGHTSDGMICSARELGLGDDHTGILVLPADSQLGLDVVTLLELRDEVLDIAVTPDRGYALSMRGMAREVATAFGLPYEDPGLLPAVGVATGAGGHPVRIDDVSGCDRYVARTVTGLDPQAVSPPWLQRRLTLGGMRSISLAVDVTNHVLLELGQPLHAFDLAALQGGIVVRRAAAGEQLATLDGQVRRLDPDDLVIADDSGPLALAGVMGGAATEVGPDTTSLLIESAHFRPVAIGRAARRHKLPSEASRRFERGVDPALGPAAAQAAVQLLVELGGAKAGATTDVDRTAPPPAFRMPVSLPGRVAGRAYEPAVVRHRLLDVGCRVEGDDDLSVTPPTWRPDLTGTADLVEEVVRLEGYDSIPVVLPHAPAGRGLTAEQRLRRVASRALSASGLVEVVSTPFVSPPAAELLAGGCIPPTLVNPLAETENLLRPSLLPGLLAAVQRNLRRGLTDVAVYEMGAVFTSPGSTAPAPEVTGRPSQAALAALDAALPTQPRQVAVALTGTRSGHRVDWADAAEPILALGTALGLTLSLRAAQQAPWHPGRSAGILLAGTGIGMVGELHPRVLGALQLPPRTVVAEVDLDALIAAAVAAGPVRAPRISAYPPASVDVALVVDAATPAADVELALRHGAGEMLEDLRLFDVYTGQQVGAGRRSLAYAMRFRAQDRTLTDLEVRAIRDAAVSEAGLQVGAVLRGA